MVPVRNGKCYNVATTKASTYNVAQRGHIAESARVLARRSAAPPRYRRMAPAGRRARTEPCPPPPPRSLPRPLLLPRPRPRPLSVPRAYHPRALPPRPHERDKSTNRHAEQSDCQQYPPLTTHTDKTLLHYGLAMHLDGQFNLHINTARGDGYDIRVSVLRGICGATDMTLVR